MKNLHDENFWATHRNLWAKLKPLAQEMRQQPTKAEKRLWEELRNKQLGVKFRRQHTIERFIADFYCREARLVIEVDGDIHHTQVEDAARTELLQALGLKVIRFSNDDVLSSMPYVIAEIRRTVKQRRCEQNPTPTPPRHGEGLQES